MCNSIPNPPSLTCASLFSSFSIISIYIIIDFQCVITLPLEAISSVFDGGQDFICRGWTQASVSVADSVSEWQSVKSIDPWLVLFQKSLLAVRLNAIPALVANVPPVPPECALLAVTTP